MKKSALLILFITCLSVQAHSQVLISLLLGDKLNSDKLEFGLIGGMQSSTLTGVDGSRLKHTFHLGFYFDFIMNDKLSFNPGVLVKSTSGVRYDNQRTDVTGIGDVDSVLVGAVVARRLNYFQVPLLMKYRITPRFHAMLGPQLALRSKSYNVYLEDVSGNELSYQEEIGDDYKRLDAGMTVGFGFKLKEDNAMNLGVRYFYGMVDVLKDNPGEAQKNRDLYFYVTIPIGKGKAAKNAAAD